jgi:hypothetical protein
MLRPSNSIPKSQAVEIIRQFGDIRIGVFRKVYGVAFGDGLKPTDTLARVFADLDEESAKKLLTDFRSKRLESRLEKYLQP